MSFRDRLEAAAFGFLAGVPVDDEPQTPEPDRADAGVVSYNMSFGQNDKLNQMRPQTSVQWIKNVEADGMVIGVPLAHRLMYGVARDALGQPWSVQIGEEAEVTKEFDAEHSIRQVLAYALGVARHKGGAHILPMTNAADLKKPMDDGEHTITAFHVLSAEDATPLTWETDIQSPRWGKPRTWSVTARRQGMSVPAFEIHWSRMVYIPGAKIAPDANRYRRGYDVAVADLYWPKLRNLEAALHAATKNATENGQPWIKLKSGMGALAGDGSSSVAGRLMLYLQKLSSMNLKVLTNDDEHGRDGVPLSGVRSEVLIGAYEAIASVEGIPLTRLLGMPPAGLTADDEAGRASYHALLDGWRSDILTPALLRIYDIAFGVADRSVVWAPLGQPTALEVAQADKTSAERDAVLVTVGAVSAEEVRTRYAGAEPLPFPVLESIADVVPTEEEIAAAEADAAEPAEDVAKQAFNGAQMTGLFDIPVRVKAGEMTKEAAALGLKMSFPSEDPAKIDAYVAAMEEPDPAAPVVDDVEPPAVVAAEE